MYTWALRNLITEFARAAKRPHVPREAAMRQLYIDAGVPLPEGSFQFLLHSCLAPGADNVQHDEKEEECEDNACWEEEGGEEEEVEVDPEACVKRT